LVHDVRQLELAQVQLLLRYARPLRQCLPDAVQLALVLLLAADVREQVVGPCRLRRHAERQQDDNRSHAGPVLAVRAVEDERQVVGLGQGLEQGRVLGRGIADDRAIGVGQDARRELGRVSGLQRLRQHRGEVARVDLQRQVSGALRESIRAAGLDLVLGTEVDDGLDPSSFELGDIRIRDLAQLTRPEDQAPLHRSSVRRSIAAEIAEVGLSREGNVTRLLRRRRSRWAVSARSEREEREDQQRRGDSARGVSVRGTRPRAHVPRWRPLATGRVASPDLAREV